MSVGHPRLDGHDLGAGGDERRDRVELVAPEDGRGLPHRDVADHGAADGGEAAQQERRHDAEPIGEGLRGPGGGPAAQDDGVGHHEQAPGGPRGQRHEPGDRRPQAGRVEVVGVGQGEGRAGLDHDVAQDAAGSGREHGQDDEAHQVEVLASGDEPAQDPVEHDPAQVQQPEGVGQGRRHVKREGREVQHPGCPPFAPVMAAVPPSIPVSDRQPATTGHLSPRRSAGRTPGRRGPRVAATRNLGWSGR